MVGLRARIKELEDDLADDSRKCESGCPVVSTLRAQADTRNQELMKLSQELDRYKSSQWDIIQANSRADAWQELAQDAMRMLRIWREMMDEEEVTT